MGSSLTCSFCQNEDNKSSYRTDSIFDDMEEIERIKIKNGYAFEYKIGPFFNQSKTKKKKTNQDSGKKNNSEIRVINEWKKMASERIDKRQSLKQNTTYTNNQFILDKIDKMLLECSLLNKETFDKNLKKGPPVPLRWGTWKATMQINQVYEAGVYERLIEKINENPENFEQISKDIIRTFPKQYYFSHSKMQGKSIGHEQLLRVLGAISNYFPDLGYCQGMNFILGFLIMVSGGNEIDVFWMFVSLVKNKNFLMIGLYEERMPLLKFLEFVTERVMEKHLNEFLESFQDIGVPNSFWMTKWYMTLFLYAFPIDICLRIWDFFISEGIFGLISILIPILRVFEDHLLNMESLDAMEFFQDLIQQETQLINPESRFYMNMSEIVDQAQKIKLNKKEIAKYAKEYVKINGNNDQNEYANIYLEFDNEKKFTILVDQLIQQKVFSHESRSRKPTQESQQSKNPAFSSIVTESTNETTKQSEKNQENSCNTNQKLQDQLLTNESQ